MERLARNRLLLAAFAALGAGVCVYAIGRDAFPFGGVLPDFLHAYGLALLTALALGRRLAGCAAWALVAGALELAQAAGAVPGTYDAWDLVASAAGAAAAWLTARDCDVPAPAGPRTLMLVGAFGVLGTLGSYVPMDEGDCTATPPPRIDSNPPAVATVGVPYVYYVDAQHECIPFVCNSVDAVRLPDGAAIDDFSDSVSWVPPPEAANKNYSFAIRTEPDSCGDVARQSWTVHVYTAPAIASFTADPQAVGPGGTSQLTGVFSGGAGSIDGLGTVTSGVATATSPLTVDTSFTLRVVNQAGHAVTNTLVVRMAQPPQIASFFAAPNLVTQNDPATLTWSATGDWNSARIEPGAIDVLGQTSVVVQPAVTTTYTITLTNAAGASDSSSAVVTAVPPPAIDAFTATPDTTTAHGSVSLLAQFHDGDGELRQHDGRHFGEPQPIASGVPTDSGELTRATTFRLTVRNPAGTEVTRDLDVSMTGPGTFAATAGEPLRPLRARHTATLLQDGRVFIAGDYADTELFDPATGSFSAGPVHPFALDDMAAAPLPDGRVLLVGGYLPDGTRVIEARYYDPVAGTLPGLGSLPVIDLVTPQAAALPDGRVLIVHTSQQQGSEAFDPVTNAFTNLPPLQWEHGCVRLAPLADGRVLVIEGSYASFAEVFSPLANAYETVGSLTHGRCYFNAAALHDGRVLVTGGSAAKVPAEVFDPATGAFIGAGSQAYGASYGATSTTLADGTVLVVGGRVNEAYPGDVFVSALADLFDPATDTFTPTGGLAQAREAHTATLLLDGRVLVVGGCRQLPCPAEIYTPP